MRQRTEHRDLPTERRPEPARHHTIPQRGGSLGRPPILDGDVVLVAPGVYSGPGNQDLRFAASEVTLRSAAGPARTLIVGGRSDQRASRAMLLEAGRGDRALVHGFTIANFSGPDGSGGAITIRSGAPRIERWKIAVNASVEPEL